MSGRRLCDDGAVTQSLIEARFAAWYHPPTDAADPRVCAHCRETHEDAIWFPIQNSRIGKYHSGGDYGVTDCGVDATEAHWVWPL